MTADNESLMLLPLECCFYLPAAPNISAGVRLIVQKDEILIQLGELIFLGSFLELNSRAAFGTN